MKLEIIRKRFYVACLLTISLLAGCNIPQGEFQAKQTLVTHQPPPPLVVEPQPVAIEEPKIVVSPPAAEPFSLNFNLSDPTAFECNSVGLCSDAMGVVFRDNTASLELVDLSIDTLPEWQAEGATFDHVSADTQGLVLSGSEWIYPESLPMIGQGSVCYSFEGTDPVAKNLCGGPEYDGMLAPGASQSSTARAGSKGIQLDGRGWVDTKFPISRAVGGCRDCTIMVWAKVSPSETGNAVRTIFGGRSGSEVLHLTIVTSRGRPNFGKATVFLQGTYTPAWSRFSSARDNLADDEWHQFALTLKSGPGNTGEFRLYIDGQEEALATATNYLGLEIPAIRIGATHKFGDGDPDPLIGYVDEFFMWDQVMNPGDLQQLYEKQLQVVQGQYTSGIIDLGSKTPITSLAFKTTRPSGKGLVAEPETAANYSAINADLSVGLQALWHLEEQDGVLKDVSGMENHSTRIDGPVTLGAPGIIGHGVELGKGGRIEFGDKINSPAIAVSAWFQADPNFNPPAQMPFIRKDGLIDLHFNGDNRMRFRVWETGRNAWDGTHYVPQPENGKWHHFVGIYDRSLRPAQNLLIYVDGILRFETQEDFLLVNSPDVLYFTNLADQPLKLDEVAIWDRKLTPEEVAEIYQRGASRVTVEFRDCPRGDCPDSEWFSPGLFSPSGFSEAYNSTELLAGLPLGATKPTAPFFLTENFFETVPMIQHLQFRLSLATIDQFGGCDGQQCLPRFEKVSFHRHDMNAADGAELPHYKFGYFNNFVAVPYKGLSKITFDDEGVCSYQISGDNGRQYFYRSEQGWQVAASGESNLSMDAAWSNHLANFPIADGQLKIRAIMGGAGEPCMIKGVSVEGYR